MKKVPNRITPPAVLQLSPASRWLFPQTLTASPAAPTPATDPAYFYGVCIVSCTIALASFPVGREYFYRTWRRQTRHELFEQKMLR